MVGIEECVIGYQEYGNKEETEILIVIGVYFFYIGSYEIILICLVFMSTIMIT